MITISKDDLGIQETIGTIYNTISERPIGTAIGIAGAGLIAGGIVAIASTKNKRKAKRKTKKKTKRTKTRKGTNRKRKKGRRQKRPYTAGKRKDTSHRRIRYTKNNQPYIIMASGKARFIKKSGVKSARKRKGGRY